MTKKDGMPMYSKNTLKILLPGTSGPISMDLGMKNRKVKPIIFCSNNKIGLTLTYFTATSNFATWDFIWEHLTMMNSLGII